MRIQWVVKLTLRKLPLRILEAEHILHEEFSKAES